MGIDSESRASTRSSNAKMDTCEDSALEMIYWLSKATNDRLGRQLGDRDWTIRQGQLLQAIEQNEGTSQTKLTSRSGIDRSTLSRMVKQLLTRRLIVRRRARLDQRTYNVFLTPSGRQLLAESRKLSASLERRILSPLNSEQRELFMLLMKQVCSAARSRQRGETPVSLVNTIG
jgi:DNA-binding MarR family transcriptional regulator